jgi:hypothetical protein
VIDLPANEALQLTSALLKAALRAAILGALAAELTR